MKKLILILSILALTGCGMFSSKQNHTAVMINTVKDICGVGEITIESVVNSAVENNDSSFKVECTISESVEVAK